MILGCNVLIAGLNLLIHFLETLLFMYIAI